MNRRKGRRGSHQLMWDELVQTPAGRVAVAIAPLVVPSVEQRTRFMEAMQSELQGAGRRSKGFRTKRTTHPSNCCPNGRHTGPAAHLQKPRTLHMAAGRVTASGWADTVL